MVHPDVNPGHQILLSDIFTVEKVVEVDRGSPWKIKVPHAAGKGLRIFATGHRQVITRPVGILEQTLRSYDSLGRTSIKTIQEHSMCCAHYELASIPGELRIL